MERASLPSGKGRVRFFRSYKYDRETGKPGGFGFIHQDHNGCCDEGCPDRGQDIYFDWVAVCQAVARGLLGSIEPGTRVAFLILPSRDDGRAPRAIRLREADQRY